MSLWTQVQSVLSKLNMEGGDEVKISLIDYFKAFHRYSKEHELSASARSLGFSLIGEFNARLWPRELCFSDNELATLSGVRTRETIRDAKNLLKECKWINFSPGKNRKSVIQLLPDNLVDNLVDNLPDNLPDNFGAGSIKRAREDAKDVKTNFIPVTVAGTREDLDKVEDYWRELGGGRLTVEHLSKLEVCLDRHGFDWVMAVMKEAADSNGSRFGASPKYLFAVIAGKEKGGERREQPKRSEQTQQPFVVPDNPVYVPPALRNIFPAGIIGNTGTA